MSRVRASALVFAAVLVSAAGCGESGRVNAPASDDGGHDGGEAGAHPASAGDANATNGGEGGADGGNGATVGHGGASGRHPNTRPGSGGSDGGKTATTGGTAGDESGGADEGGAPTGGTSSAGNANGGSGPSGGGMTSAAGGTLGGSGALAGSGGASAGSGGAGVSNQLSVCLRLSGATKLAIDVATDFENAFIADCHINWVFYLYWDDSIGLHERDKFQNQMLAFNFALWGCAGAPPPMSFDLIYKPEPLSLADAGALIDAYMSVASRDLSLSPPEKADMRAALERLSQPLLIVPDPGDFTQSRCKDDGGAGGQGGADAGGTGASASAGDTGQGGAG